jgi:hypothetical protein
MIINCENDVLYDFVSNDSKSNKICDRERQHDLKTSVSITLSGSRFRPNASLEVDESVVKCMIIWTK